MGHKTGISWTDHTWNPWRGCTKISPGCDNCYMFTAQTRYGNDPSFVVKTKTWQNPYRWQKDAELLGETRMVFTCSWSDFFHKDADAWRADAWGVIRSTPNLIYQILTKRSGMIKRGLPEDWADGYKNVWLGVSVESPEYYWRIEQLRRVPAVVRFVSAEPLLAPMPTIDLSGIHWLIVGGESGYNHRHMPLGWARDLRDHAKMSGTAFFFKQVSGPRAEMGCQIDGKEWKEYPLG